MTALRQIRPLKRESLHGIEPAKVSKKLPKFEIVDPSTLYIEEAYQRGILTSGITLIRKIVAGWSWSSFKPPICVRMPKSGNVLVCIDGQHTATAAAIIPSIEKIPVMVVDAADVVTRARAFIGHNKDRLGLTTVAIYAAELAAGDEIAAIVHRACRAAGASIPRRMVASKEKQPVGTTISLGIIKAIAKRQGEEALIRVLRLLVGVGRAPIKSVEIAATALILARHPTLVDKRLARVIGSKTDEEWTGLGQVEAAKSGKAIAIGIAALWCDELGIDAPRPNVKGNQTDHARLIPAAEPAPKKPSRVLAGQPSGRFEHFGDQPKIEDKSALRRMLAEAAANTAKMERPR